MKEGIAEAARKWKRTCVSIKAKTGVRRVDAVGEGQAVRADAVVLLIEDRNIKMRPQEIIAKKRDGGDFARENIDEFINGVCDSSWADYQISALIMAMFINGLDLDEQDALTYAMLHSGEILHFSDIDAPKADKHSTGGVGDKTSLIIAAACCRMRCCGADDLGPRAGSYRRDARQAGVNPWLQRKSLDG